MELVNVIKTPGPGVATVNAEVIRNKENKEVLSMMGRTLSLPEES